MKLLVFMTLFIIFILKTCNTAPLYQGFHKSFPTTLNTSDEIVEKSSNEYIRNEYKKNETNSRYPMQHIKS